MYFYMFFFSSRRRHTRLQGDWSSDVCSSDLTFEGFHTSHNINRAEPASGYCGRCGTSQRFHVPFFSQYDERPPSAGTVTPVIMRASSEARNIAIRAISSGSPTENG